MTLLLQRSGIPRTNSFTVSGTPAAGGTNRTPFFRSNAGASGSFWYDDGVRLRPVNNRCMLKTLNDVSASINNAAEVIVFQYLIPAGLVKDDDILRATFSSAKSGTVDGANVRFRFDTEGLITDDPIFGSTSTFLAAANQSSSAIVDFRRESATSLLMLGNSGQIAASAGYSNSSNSAVAAAVTVNNMDNNDIFFSIGLLSAGATNTVNLRSVMLELIAPTA